MLNIERESKINANAHSMSRLTSLNESCKTQIPQPKEVLFLKSTLRDSHWIQSQLQMQREAVSCGEQHNNSKSQKQSTAIVTRSE
ncbi:hypothetical protein T01_2337 [Trichinella spiralis]|uniref:Uncharacterized protein n=1 Tax=Trichinella spiralis TaxID=6334 RepID=A0A0V1B2C6_TRISP|nr:hypothetical protein T01_2669 [Trichinella spiralis]KRY31140.1 hypothetical protein T01_2337 [Trichinella spiralis]